MVGLKPTCFTAPELERPRRVVAASKVNPDATTMLKGNLDGCSILLVEDDAVIADDLTTLIEQAGGRLIGPADSLGQGFQLLDGAGIDCALLDINLNSLLVFGLADVLVERHVPFIFLSANSAGEIPERHKQRPFLQKPFARENLLAALHAAMPHTGSSLTIAAA